MSVKLSNMSLMKLLASLVSVDLCSFKSVLRETLHLSPLSYLNRNDIYFKLVIMNRAFARLYIRSCNDPPKVCIRQVLRHCADQNEGLLKPFELNAESSSR